MVLVSNTAAEQHFSRNSSVNIYEDFLQVFILHNFKSLRMRTYKLGMGLLKTGGLNSFRIRTYVRSSPNWGVMNTYKKWGGWGVSFLSERKRRR